MKKIFVYIISFMMSSILFAQSAEYKKYLELAKKYELERRWCFALGAYYDAMSTDENPELKQEAYLAYTELKDSILNGIPGNGIYDAFTIHDEWKNLLIDAEKYGNSIGKYELIVGDFIQGDLNYETKTVSYSVVVQEIISDRYIKTIKVIDEGYNNVFKNDWSSDMPKPSDWPQNSVSSNYDDIYNMDGALIFSYPRLYPYGIYLWFFENAFESNSYPGSLYEYTFNIIDENGKEIVEGKKYLKKGGAEKLIIDGVPPNVIPLIENGQAFLNLESVYLKYGQYSISEDIKDKNLSKKRLDLDKMCFLNRKQRGEMNAKNAESSFIWWEEKQRSKEFINEVKDLFVDIPREYYSMSTTEVTQKIYKTVMGENPSYFSDDNRPVETVSWYDAIYFCNKLSEMCGFTPVYSVDGNTNTVDWKYKPHRGDYIHGVVERDIFANGFRLPTADEWKFAAKGDQKYTYSGSENLDDVGWFRVNSEGKTHPVAQKMANEYGLYDMSGNVLEWTEDVFFKGAGRYCLGGSWNDDSIFCKIYKTGNTQSPKYRSKNLGFRIVTSAFRNNGWIGVSLLEATKEYKEELGVQAYDGVFAVEVFTNSPAFKGEIKPGDYIIELNGKKVKTVNQLVRDIGSLRVGTTATFKVIRGGKVLPPLTVKVEERAKDNEIQNNKMWPGFIATPLTDDVKKQLKIDDKKVHGVVVSNVEEKSPAASLRLQNGDVITAVNGKPVANLAEFYAELANLQRSVNFDLYSNGGTITTGTYKF